jgi:hypothetical protein
MCGGSDAKIRKDELQLYLGYMGAEIKINESIIYCPNETKNHTYDREEMAGIMSKMYTKKDLIEIMLQIVDNGSEE